MLVPVAAFAAMWIGSGSGMPRVLAAHPIVAGFERFVGDATDEASLAASGRILLGELNCLACHRESGGSAAHDAARGVLTKGAPILDNVGARIRPEAIARMLLDPQTAKPGTTMPDLLAGLPEERRKQSAEALTHFLASTGTVHDTAPDPAGVKRGEMLFHTVGCVACHASRREDDATLATSVPLPDLAAKYTIGSLAAFLANPLHVRPGGRMPDLNLTPQEARDIASYFLKDVEAPPTVRFAYYEGQWSNLPDFDQLQPKAQGLAVGINLQLSQRKENYGLRFEGYLPISREGEYRFFLGSDDGSRLSIDGKPVITVDGLHPYQQKNQARKLKPGLHAVRIDFFQGGVDAELTAEIEGPDLPRQPLGLLLRPSQEPPQPANSFKVDPALAAQGRQLFSTLGCATCHAMKHEGATLPNQLTSPGLTSLDPSRGCLAEKPTAQAPKYDLDGRQRTALAAALRDITRQPTPPAKNADGHTVTIDHTMTAFNCYACHTRNQRGGVEPERNAWFQGTTQEMGDEGRIPPALDGVGAKLTEAWLKHIFADGAKDRPYMHTRMPQYGTANVGHLVAAFIKADGYEPRPPYYFNEPAERVKGYGRFMVGGQAFACIKCHTFGKYEATGIQSIDLTIMTRRLNRDWFEKYLLNPQAYRPGTRMPSAWPEGKSLLKNVLDGEAVTQINAIWEYLSDGPQARIPEGLLRSAIELKPLFAPRVYRNFIEGAGTRAIGVGYPERANLAFDAENLRLALIWHAGFIDAGRHWSARGQGFQPPLGDHVIAFPDGVSFAVLSDVNAPWPAQSARELGYRFRGYELDEKKRPEFRYTLSDGTVVRDYFEPVPQEFDPWFKRTIHLTVKDDAGNWYYRAAVGNKIEPAGEGVWQVDGGLKLQLSTSGSQAPLVRTSGGRTELLVPIEFTRGEAQIVQVYMW